jgi:ferritin-like metal-binding protein YciE
MNRTLKNLFLEELEDMYDAEHRIVKSLPILIEAATCEDLKSALETHMQETEEQIRKLESVFNSFGEKARRGKCQAVTGLLEEAQALIKKNTRSTAINAAIIAAAQKVEHCEIASYGCLKAWAAILGYVKAVSAVEEILDQEKEADLALSELAAAKNEEARQEAQPGTLRQ